MSDQTSREVAIKDLRQVCIAVAILLVLYGILRPLDFLLDLARVYFSYYFCIAFQIIVAILIIFIGFKVYAAAKTLKITNLTRLWREVRPQFFVLLLGCVLLLAVTLYPPSAYARALYLTNLIVLDPTQHTAFISRSWIENPTFKGQATGFIYSGVTLENNKAVPHSGIMVFLWGNYSYRLFDMDIGDVYFTTEDAPSRGILLSLQRPFYLVYLEGARPEPYSIWSKDDIAFTTIRIVEGALQYPFVTGDLVNSVIPAWNLIEAHYSSGIDRVVEELNKIQYNTLRVFVRPFWFESDTKNRLLRRNAEMVRSSNLSAYSMFCFQ